MAQRRGGRGGRASSPKYLGTAEVAELLGVTTARVRQMALAGILKEALRAGGRRLYDPAAVEAFKRKRAKRTR